ncbi:MAG TPA: hypothetical protein VFH98_06270 [Candidatus Limnocylindria bacterium]|nr:hypothetical protein [Candidatus Limnocylindria bacterium]
MDKGHWVDFELTVTGVDASLQVRIGSFAERSVASVELGALRTNGIGATAREALVAALAPLGNRMTTAVMSAPAMFGVSARLLAAGE